MRTKDVANLINISPRSVETARYRIKKKLGLGKDENLFDYLYQLHEPRAQKPQPVAGHSKKYHKPRTITEETNNIRHLEQQKPTGS